MRVVGQTGRYNETPSPQEAFVRSVALDRALPKFDTRPRRVQRLSHAQMNAQDDSRMLLRAKLLNA